MNNEKKSIFARFAAWVEGDEPILAAKPQPVFHKKKHRHHEMSNKEEVEQYNHFSQFYRLASVVICAVMTCLLLFTVASLPIFGGENNPTVNEVAERYLEKGVEETGAVNAVAGIILSYRIFDTFGESNVLFLAASAVMMLLIKDRKNYSPADEAIELHELELEHQERDIILEDISLILIPVIFLYGIYVILNGHISPGGGFSGGAIMGAGLILYAAAFGDSVVQRFLNHHLYHIIKVVALYIYGVLLLYYVFTGANSLESLIPLGTPGAILSSGVILPIDIAVGFEVACTMYGFFILFDKGEI